MSWRDTLHPSAIRNRLIAWRARTAFRRAIARPGPHRLIIGASGTAMPGWISAEVDSLDVRVASDWERAFPPGSLLNILAEHVWEHLTATDGAAATRNCFRFLAPGGRLRLAVPDGQHPDPAYIDAVRPGGSGPGAGDHRTLYTLASLSELLGSAGFRSEPLEWFDAAGGFHAVAWDDAHGRVQRSLRHDHRNNGLVPRWTSLIIDAVKPT